MSTYMKALRRLERDGQLAAAPAVPARPWPSREAETAPARRAVPAAPRPATPAVAELLDRLRGLAAQGEPARVLVVAPIAVPGGARGVVDALAARGAELRLPVAVAELARSGGAAQLIERAGRAEARPAAAVDLDGPRLGDALRDWLAAVAHAPLVLIEAPPLQRSIDAVLLAAAADGLVLVAETGATERADLRAAAERARLAGCNTVGVVLVERAGAR
jgi:hypothetical protein